MHTFDFLKTFLCFGACKEIGLNKHQPMRQKSYPWFFARKTSEQENFLEELRQRC